MIQMVTGNTGSRIRILTFHPFRIQGSKIHRIPDPGPQDCIIPTVYPDPAFNFYLIKIQLPKNTGTDQRGTGSATLTLCTCSMDLTNN
jgi:hypothetical protein